MGGTQEAQQMCLVKIVRKWFCGLPLDPLACLWLPVKQNTNLTADKIPLMSPLCLLTYYDNNLSQVYLSFSFFPSLQWDCGCLLI